MTRSFAAMGGPDFLRLWSAQAVSAVGARITREGLPMAAVLVLGASPGQIGLLAALTRGPALVVGLMSGGLADRSRRRGLLIAMDVARAVLLATIPIAAWLHLLSIIQIYLTAALVGAASVLFEIADHAYLPTLVARSALTDANARLSATEAVAEVGGPAMAGLLFQWLGGPYAIALNALTYLVSAGFLSAIVTREARPATSQQPRWGRDVIGGLRATLAEPRVAPLLLLQGGNAVFGAFFSALYILFALRTVGLDTALFGLTIASGGLGALAGAVIAPRVAGVGPAIIISSILAAVTMFFIPLAPADRVAGMAFLCASQVLGDALWVTSDILTASLRQTLLPQEILGRVAATFQAVAGALGIVGALVGGALGGWIGPRETLMIACAGMLLGPLATAFSTLRHYRAFA